MTVDYTHWMRSKRQSTKIRLHPMSEPSVIFYLKIEQMDWTRFERMTGYDLRHRYLGHNPNKFIQPTCQLNIQLDLRSSMERNSVRIRNVPHAWLGNHSLMTTRINQAGRDATCKDENWFHLIFNYLNWRTHFLCCVHWWLYWTSTDEWIKNQGWTYWCV